MGRLSCLPLIYWQTPSGFLQPLYCRRSSLDCPNPDLMTSLSPLNLSTSQRNYFNTILSWMYSTSPPSKSMPVYYSRSFHALKSLLLKLHQSSAGYAFRTWQLNWLYWNVDPLRKFSDTLKSVTTTSSCILSKLFLITILSDTMLDNLSNTYSVIKYSAVNSLTYKRDMPYVYILWPKR